MRYHGFKHHIGFTLIELLVVISIISLLSAIGVASLNTTRAKARDTRRIADIQQLKTAVELFYDANGYPPSDGTDRTTKCALYAGVPHPTYSMQSILQPLVSSGFIATIPCDPLGAQQLTGVGGSVIGGYNNNYYYLSRSDGWDTYPDYCGTDKADLFEYVFFLFPEKATFALPPMASLATPPTSAASTCGGGSTFCCVTGPRR
ncbi:MAG TPA: prepilin-type N-terminal cleavage/methylation domain-containing protein [Patescibacteria group bacterium]|nr:prepilin-type N-terminal cleavage/methylation domain-containing protein [Patescibacteria group bacterium]